MNKHWLFFWMCFFLWLSCGRDQKPSKVLPDEILIPVLMDIHLLEAQLERQGAPLDSLFYLAAYNYQLVFQEHQIERLQFESTMMYYFQHPDQMDILYEKVLDSMQSLESHVSAGSMKRFKMVPPSKTE